MVKNRDFWGFLRFFSFFQFLQICKKVKKWSKSRKTPFLRVFEKGSKKCIFWPLNFFVEREAQSPWRFVEQEAVASCSTKMGVVVKILSWVLWNVRLPQTLYKKVKKWPFFWKKSKHFEKTTFLDGLAALLDRYLFFLKIFTFFQPNVPQLVQNKSDKMMLIYAGHFLTMSKFCPLPIFGNSVSFCGTLG